MNPNHYPTLEQCQELKRLGIEFDNLLSGWAYYPSVSRYLLNSRWAYDKEYIEYNGVDNWRPIDFIFITAPSIAEMLDWLNENYYSNFMLSTPVNGEKWRLFGKDDDVDCENHSFAQLLADAIIKIKSRGFDKPTQQQ